MSQGVAGPMAIAKRKREGRDKPSLTPKRVKLIKNLKKGMTITDAARDAGYSVKAPGQAGWHALQAIQQRMPEVLDRAGLTDEALVEKHLKPLLNATETKFFAFQGEVHETRTVPALSIRKDALDLTFRLKGSYAPIEQQLQHIHEITVLERAKAAGSLEKIRALQSDSENPLLSEVVDTPEEK